MQRRSRARNESSSPPPPPNTTTTTTSSSPQSPRRSSTSKSNNDFSLLFLIGGCTLLCWILVFFFFSSSYEQRNNQGTRQPLLDVDGGMPVRFMGQGRPAWGADSNSNMNTKDKPAEKKNEMNVNNVRRSAKGITNTNNQSLDLDLDGYREARQRVQSEFEARYGGKEAAERLLERGVFTFENKDTEYSGVWHTAQRLLNSRRRRTMNPHYNNSLPTFTMSFGGYSVTVGRGNYFSQSFPFVAQRLLKTPFQKLGIDLVVRNAAIGGIPSFPYAWCMRNFLGEDADVVSWDFSMNEGKGSQGLEAYIRQASTLPNSPLFLLLDSKKSRRDLVQSYVHSHTLLDPIAVSREGLTKNNPYLEQITNNQKDTKVKEEEEEEMLLPEGYKGWNTWGSPKGSPGQSPWHPKKQEHEMLGWVVAMHFLKAADLAAESLASGKEVEGGVESREGGGEDGFGKPKNEGQTTPHEIYNMMLGRPASTSSTSNNNNHNQTPSSSWKLSRKHCLTSFQHLFGGGSLRNYILTGMQSNPNVPQPMDSNDASHYQGGWLWSVGKVERDTKRKLYQFDENALGYIDMKTALYGLPSSGALEIWLPVPLKGEKKKEGKGVVQSLVVCEVNEKRGPKECDMVKDVAYTIGGVKVEGVERVQAPGMSYLQKPICVWVPVPQGATVEERPEALEGEGGREEEEWGVRLKVEVVGESVTLEDGACSVSHVVWEEAEGGNDGADAGAVAA